MAEARCQDGWSHTSAMLAMIANANRDPKKKKSPYKPADFNPMLAERKTAGIPLTTENIGILKTVFVDGKS